MIIIVYSETNSTTIGENFGKSEYSYFFVLKEFLPVLRQLGTVFAVNDPFTEVDAIYRDATARGESCIFLSFSPPHRMPLGLACPTIPVFAWEFDSIPTETWFGEPFQDWRYVLKKTGRAITHSKFAVGAVRAAMGEDFPIASIPAPLYERFAGAAAGESLSFLPQTLTWTNGGVIDSRRIDWTNYVRRDNPNRSNFSEEPPTNIYIPEQEISLDGVVYTSIFSPYDGRKNYLDILNTFCWAFRDIADATLAFKLIQHSSRKAIDRLTDELYRLLPFRCRIVVVDCFLSEVDYIELMLSTTYAVNASSGEGQCLPLMEYISAGKPAIAPIHTAMADYISADNAFVVDTTRAVTMWPHDPRGAFRTLTNRIDCTSLLRAFQDSYHVAKEAPDLYRAMAGNARSALQKHCSSEVVRERLSSFLNAEPRSPRINVDYGRIPVRDISYALGTTIDFTKEVGARRYLLAGWSGLELGYGVWSDGAVAELAFALDTELEAALTFRVHVTPHISPGHPDIKVTVSANGIDLDQWKFSYVYRDQIAQSRRTVTIPTDAVTGNELRIKLFIEHPISPWELGISSDERDLGLALHSLSIAKLRQVS